MGSSIAINIGFAIWPDLTRINYAIKTRPTVIYYIVLKSIGAPRIIINREDFPPGLHTLTVTVTAEDGQRTISDTTGLLFQGYNSDINVMHVIINLTWLVI